MKVDVDDPGAVAFAASFLRGNTAGHVWDSYQASLPPDHVVTWAEFKKTLRDNLDDEDAFIDRTWSNFFTYQQRQSESVRAFPVTLQQIYAVLREYDPIAASSESMMIYRMRHAICPKIRIALYNTGERVKNFTLFMNRVISAEASAAMRASARTAKRNQSRNASLKQSSKHRDESASNKRGKKPDRDSKPNTGKPNTPATDSNADVAKVICFTSNKPGRKFPACPGKDKSTASKKLIVAGVSSKPVTDFRESGSLAPLPPPLAPSPALLLPQLEREPCMLYDIGLENRKFQSLIDSGSEVNAISQNLVKSLKLSTLHTHWGAAKIDGSRLATFGMILVTFSAILVGLRRHFSRRCARYALSESS